MEAVTAGFCTPPWSMAITEQKYTLRLLYMLSQHSIQPSSFEFRSRWTQPLYYWYMKCLASQTALWTVQNVQTWIKYWGYGTPAGSEPVLASSFFLAFSRLNYCWFFYYPWTKHIYELGDNQVFGSNDTVGHLFEKLKNIRLCEKGHRLKLPLLGT